MRSLQTELPLCRERSSGSVVRLPVITTTLMFVAATRGLLSLSKLGSPGLDRGSEVSPYRVADWDRFLTETGRSCHGARVARRFLALDALGAALGVVRLGSADDRRREVGRRRRARSHLGDAEAQHAVGDL